jgi:hypothetical protein
VHLSYFERVIDGWVVARGGRCYRSDETMKTLSKKVQCPNPSCEKWCHDKDGYVQHWHDKHHFIAED